VGDADAVIRSLAGLSKAQGRDVSSTGRRLVMGNLLPEDSDDTQWDELDKKVNQYPFVREFKCIGSGGEDFVQGLLASAVEVTRRPLRREEVVVRQSRNGNYQSVSIYIEVISGEEVRATLPGQAVGRPPSGLAWVPCLLCVPLTLHALSCPACQVKAIFAALRRDKRLRYFL
jgi:putative lipoic acid-binding regulatory protein